MTIIGALPGFYVEKRYYGMRYAQALARARFLAGEYGRAVHIFFRPPQGDVERVLTVLPDAGAVYDAHGGAESCEVSQRTALAYQ